MRVRDVLTADLVTVSPDASVREAARVMDARRVGCLVVEHEGGAIGVLTERDVVRRVVAHALDPDHVRVGDVLSAPVLAIHPDASLDEAVQRMIRHDVRRLVVAAGDEVVGLVTATAIARALPEVERRFVETWVRPSWVD